jgi:putative ubiquitin-RnfH superfamily antitoxin RatB of RatAB toxin-antitoxin module
MISAVKPTAMTTETRPNANIRIEVVHALPEAYQSLWLVLDSGARVADALEQAGRQGFLDLVEVDASRLAIFSRLVDASTPLRDGDRIEVLRPLQADPKQARRNRALGSGPRKR